MARLIQASGVATKRMPAIRACEVPAVSLLGRYAASGAYADCYVTEVPFQVSHSEFIGAFYTTWLFKIERLVLRLVISSPSTDIQARQLAEGELSTFAAWSVEARTESELLVAAGSTRSWLMVAPRASAGCSGAQLYFGSAVVPKPSAKTGHGSMGLLFRALLGFYKRYSRALLRAARARLCRQHRSAGHDNKPDVTRQDRR